MPTIEPFLARSDQEIAVFSRLERDSADEAFPIFWTPTDIEVRFSRPSEYADVRGYLCRDETGTPVGLGVLELPMTENTALADVYIAVVRAHRGRGYGSALAEHIRRDALSASRSTLMMGASWSPGETSSPGRRFVERAGLTLRNTVYHQVLSLPVDLDAVRLLASQAAEHHASYRIITWQGRCPDEWLDQLAEIQGRMNSEVPLGDLELEAEVYDAARIRHDEAEAAARQRTGLMAVAVSADEKVVGFTQLMVPAEGADAFQWDTMVLPEHRGHRLGLAMKAANMLEFAAMGRPSRVIHTWNAITNAPMIAVNDKFGFRPADYRGEFQGPLGD